MSVSQFMLFLRYDHRLLEIALQRWNGLEGAL